MHSRISHFGDWNGIAAEGAAIDYMEARAGDRLLLRDLARVTGLSQSHFSRAFKATTAVPPYQWHLNMHIKRVQHLLLGTQASIAQIAAMTGFADLAHLTRVFARLRGNTPAAWQRERRYRRPGMLLRVV